MKQFFLTAIFVFLITFPCFAVDSTVSAVREYRRANEHKFLSEFVELLSIPNVAADRRNIRRNADYLVAEMQKRGLKPKLLTAADETAPPAVYGEWNAPGATRTIVFLRALRRSADRPERVDGKRAVETRSTLGGVGKGRRDYSVS